MLFLAKIQNGRFWQRHVFITILNILLDTVTPGLFVRLIIELDRLCVVIIGNVSALQKSEKLCQLMTSMYREIILSQKIGKKKCNSILVKFISFRYCTKVCRQNKNLDDGITAHVNLTKNVTHYLGKQMI